MQRIGEVARVQASDIPHTALMATMIHGMSGDLEK